MDRVRAGNVGGRGGGRVRRKKGGWSAPNENREDTDMDDGAMDFGTVHAGRGDALLCEQAHFHALFSRLLLALVLCLLA